LVGKDHFFSPDVMITNQGVIIEKYFCELAGAFGNQAFDLGDVGGEDEFPLVSVRPSDPLVQILHHLFHWLLKKISVEHKAL
jgi:hypothetical protein